jgi:DegV family protein with EDD domain
MIELVTDSTADVPSGTPGITSVPARVAFAERNFVGDQITPADFYNRMMDERPAPSAPTEDDYIAAFTSALERADAVACLVTPFDMIPSFTAANAAALSMAGQPVKIVNAGIASAGLCSVLVSLTAGTETGWDMARLLDAVDEIVPRSDSLFVPASIEWLERAGRRQLIENKVGPLDGRVPVVRTATRLTGVAAADTAVDALAAAVDLVGRRAGDATPLVVTIGHAINPEGAERAAALMQERWKVEKLAVTDLSPTYGSQLGPGAIGIGVAPVVT